MSRVCFFTGRKTSAGNSIARRGKAKRLGGVGKNITGVTKRKFKANIQKVRAVIDGRCVIALSGLLHKAHFDSLGGYPYSADPAVDHGAITHLPAKKQPTDPVILPKTFFFLEIA